MDRADPEGVGRDRSAPPGPPVFRGVPYRGFHPRLLMELPCGEHGKAKRLRVALVEPVADPNVSRSTCSKYLPEALLATFLSQGRPLR